MDSQVEITPFLKWAGGKRWLVQNYADLVPQTFNRYFEPFLGSGAVFFYLQPNRAVLSDINSELIDTYVALKAAPQLVWRYLRKHQVEHSSSYYYRVRDSKPRSLASIAARTIYLNRTCWNALYRVNLSGQFNVPIGSKQSVVLPTDDFYAVSSLLQRADLCVADFQAVMGQARKNDFVFVDPPYTVNHNLNGFLKYNEKIFSWQDQERLRDSVEDAACRGAKILITNADHASVDGLYRDFRRFRLSRQSVIAASNSFRGQTTELVIQCW